MKTIEINLYEFSELSEKAKEKVLDKYFDLNVSYDWWCWTFEDAKNIGLQIDTFDICRKNDITGSFNLSACEVAANIFKEHGESCETYKTSKKFMNDWQPVFNDYMDETKEHYESFESENLMLDLETEFLNSLLEDYLIILRHEYEYLTSKEAIIETIEANEYTFEENGKMNN